MQDFTIAQPPSSPPTHSSYPSKTINYKLRPCPRLPVLSPSCYGPQLLTSTPVRCASSLARASAWRSALVRKRGCSAGKEMAKEQQKGTRAKTLVGASQIPHISRALMFWEVFCGYRVCWQRSGKVWPVVGMCGGC